MIPTVHERDPFWHMKARGEAYRQPIAYADIELPRNSGMGPVLAVAGAACGFGLVWHIWWMVIAAFLLAVGAVIARSFVVETTRIIPAREVRRTEERWLRAVASYRPAGRDDETEPDNHGLADLAAI